jgi:hypothetical protein
MEVAHAECPTGMRTLGRLDSLAKMLEATAQEQEDIEAVASTLDSVL